MGKRRYDSWVNGQVFKIINDKYTDHIGLWQLNKLRTMKTINEINTDLTEGKLLIAALSILSTTPEFSGKTHDEIVSILNDNANNIFVADGVPQNEVEDLRDPSADETI